MLELWKLIVIQLGFTGWVNFYLHVEKQWEKVKFSFFFLLSLSDLADFC